MKTAEQTVKAIKNRISRLELFNKEIATIRKNTVDENGLMSIYFENEARMDELLCLLEYIQGQQNET